MGNNEVGRPRHVAVIMDGNGRWAQERGLRRVEGHREGGMRRDDSCAPRMRGIECVSLYAFSTELVAAEIRSQCAHDPDRDGAHRRTGGTV